MQIEPDVGYRALQSRDARFDGTLFVGVRSTGIYCRPSCPARTPNRVNVRFYPSAAAAQRAGLRACKRCRPDATPGSAEWNVRADLAGRAVRLIADGVIDREGVPGLARQLGYSERQVVRALVAELGAPPVALARAQRAQTARILLESTALPASDVAFAAGFASIRQFNDTIREVFDATPSELRLRASTSSVQHPGTIELRLAHRAPMDLRSSLRFLAARAVKGVEATDGQSWYSRSLDLPHGPGVATVRAHRDHVRASLQLSDHRDLTAAVARLRRLLDLDADPAAVDASFSRLASLAPLVARRPGLRSVGAVDGFEMAVRALVGQQISVAGARTILARLTNDHGAVVPGDSGLRLFPGPDVIAALSPDQLPMPRTRSRAVIDIAQAVAGGTLVLGPGADRAQTRAHLLELKGVGAWTADYILMRALGDPDIFMASDLGVRHALERLEPVDPASAAPWRSYLTHHLWASLDDESTLGASDPESRIGFSRKDIP